MTSPVWRVRDWLAPGRSPRWDERAVPLPVPSHWEAVHVPDADPILAALEVEFLDGPVFHRPAVGDAYVLVPPGTHGHWDVEGSRIVHHGRGTNLLCVPDPARTEPGPDGWPYWPSPPRFEGDGRVRLADPEVLRRILIGAFR
ncbi:hypothetical protein [Streptomyces sp. YIM 98790]|uniref:hypothetical protein n=1 Tax=Streptomyces sp. YIM 98790 TaxID=2689077 RepID=UPI0014097587|nr:hypothetical protein [Streptomyces sp. YIM 98790]